MARGQIRFASKDHLHLSAIATIVMLLTRAVHVWTSSSEAAGGATVRLVVTLMFLMTMGMLLYLFHGERPPEFYERGANHRAHPFSSGKETPSRDTQSRQ